MLTPLNKWPDELSVKHNMLFATVHMIKFFINFCSSYSLCSAVIKAMENTTNNEIWFIVNCIYNKMHWNTWSLKEDGWFNCSYTVTETTRPISPLSLCMCVRAWVIEGRARVRAPVLSADSPDVTAGTALSRAVSKSWDRSSRLETESSSEFTDELDQRSCWRTTLTPLYATGKKLKPLRVRWISAEGRAVWIIQREKQ